MEDTATHTHPYTFIRTISPVLTHTRKKAHWNTLVLVVSLLGSLNSSMRTLFSEVNGPSDSHPCSACAYVCLAVRDCHSCARMLCVCVGPSSFVWAQLRGESCFACGSASQTSCSATVWSPEGSFFSFFLLNKLILHCSLIWTSDKITSTWRRCFICSSVLSLWLFAKVTDGIVKDDFPLDLLPWVSRHSHSCIHQIWSLYVSKWKMLSIMHSV